MPNFRTQFMGYSVEWSPFDEGLLAVGTAQNFGIIGQGKAHVLQVTSAGLVEVAALDTKDGVFDVAWSETAQAVVALACGDGSVKIWDTARGKIVANYTEHTAEVYSVDWNLVNKENVVSGAWDNVIKLWHASEPRAVQTFAEHTGCIYSTIWHPRNPDLFASTSGDNKLKVWDINTNKSVLTLVAHDYEVLTCDWNKYNEYEIATGSVDKTIRVWDTRKLEEPTMVLGGHEFAVRRLKYSPHSERVLASASYDMSMKVWDTALPENTMTHSYDQHTEFVVGLDWNLFVENRIALASWDEWVSVFEVGGKPEPLS